ncbi:Z1 domain-containing protein [Microbispora bryophytorum]|nr:Z1 domain-containing protein [Microbispora bryophytorum]TQS10270.1 hypothetical protein FLX07_02270 [Microbispora bryophytorum]
MIRRGPRDLHAMANGVDPGVAATDVALRELLKAADRDDALFDEFQVRLATWDKHETADWTEGTKPSTNERRDVIIRRLTVDDATAGLLLDLFPVAGGASPIVIAPEWDEWYTDEIRRRRNFYWIHYAHHLREKGWDADAVSSLDVATDRVVERLSDPTRPEIYSSRGLVVGYVQSGKTANFTGVIAKAIDVGYRLVIVLTGTTNMLREQTQRRLDMELVGVENILRGIDPNNIEAMDKIDYRDDDDWRDGKFVRHGLLPSDAGRPDIHRLTTRAKDYKSLHQGIAALDVDRRERHRPFYDPANLFNSDARLVVLKKNSTVMKKLVADLKMITTQLEEIPTLIIDDESDQASVNTSNPKKWKEEQKERTAINRLISELLSMLPRAQYVGYTATPFANVFVDPTDAQDIFPKDFLISLRRPPGYMGARDFHDFDDGEVEGTHSSEEAHVRYLDPDESQEHELRDALDMFVLTGALKLYRQERGYGRFRHHTMLVHEAMQRAQHSESARQLRQLWDSAGYFSPRGLERLRSLYENDVRRVSTTLGQAEATPEFDQVARYVGTAVRLIAPHGDPVIIVNSDKDTEREELDFDHNAVWRVLVGGNKLARGFTVEGLTVSYYRRGTKQADTLMQMGRWFGFRKGYQDLVRLFITEELHEAFEGIVLDEELFRDELRRYADLVDGRPQITPAQIPPLVHQHLPWIKPTSASKMYNAELVLRRSPGAPIEPRAYPSKSERIAANAEVWRPLVAAIDRRVRFGGDGTPSFEADVAVVTHEELLDALRRLEWAASDVFIPDLSWLVELRETGKVKDWVLIFPRHVRAGEAKARIFGSEPMSLFRRKRIRTDYFSAISESRHRTVAAAISKCESPAGDETARGLRGPQRGAAIIYPVVEKDYVAGDPSNGIDPRNLTFAFRLLAPESATSDDRKLIAFRTKVNSKPEQAIVDAHDEAPWVGGDSMRGSSRGTSVPLSP